MTKVELLAKVMLAEAKNPDIPDDKKIEVLVDGLKTFSIESLNLLQYLNDKKAEPDVIVGILENQGFQFDGRTKKFK